MSLFYPFSYHYEKLFHQLLFEMLLWKSNIIFHTKNYCFIVWYVLIVLTFEIILSFVKIYPFTKHHKCSIDLFWQCLENFRPQLLHYITPFFVEPLLTLHIPITQWFYLIYWNFIWTKIIRIENNILRITNFDNFKST